jgi:hypothetical protein
MAGSWEHPKGVIPIFPQDGEMTGKMLTDNGH